MTRNLALLGAAILAVVGLSAKIAWDAAPELRPLAVRDAGPDSAASAAALAVGAAVEGVASTTAVALAALQNDAGALPSLGETATPLPPGARPKVVRFGVVLVQFAGAQGAGTTARGRDEATRLAGEIAALARTDFKAAVARGDTGSTEDAGRIQHGVLEAAAEDALFSLPVNEVTPPVATPRGYWIVKRLE